MRLMKASRWIVYVVAGMILSALMSDGLGAARKADQAKEGTASVPLALRVVGTQILNSHDEPVRLRGVNCASLEWTSDGEGHIVESVRVAIDDWRVNHIRLPLSQDRWFGKASEQSDQGKAYRALVDKIVKLCASKGVYIMLELHWSNAGVWGEQIGQHSMPDEHSVTFWKDLAPIYANHPAAGPTLISGWDYEPTAHFGVYVKQMLADELPPYTPPDPSETPAERAPVRPSPSRISGWGLYGDWEVKVEFGEREMDAIMSFSMDREGNLVAQWISFWGFTELKDVRFEDNKLNFIQVVRFGDNEFSSNFVGTVKDGKLSGTLSNDRGDSKVEGTRARRIPLAVGNWKMKFHVVEREITTELVVRETQEGKWAAEWQSEWGEHEITDFQYERGRLTFKRKSEFQDRQLNSTFEGTIQWQTGTLSGVIKSGLGEVAAQGERINSELIGNWNLDVATDRGDYKQRLKVNRDMTGMYGTIPIEEVHVEDDKVSFLATMQSGDQEFEMTFKGKLAESKLTGELKTSRGTQKVVGKKMARPL